MGNVRWDVEATPGYEDVPLIVLQAHMDMVVVSDDGRDMTQSPIAVVVDEENNVITSDGHTSLGSDDGMGLVSIMYLVTTDEYAHGPLRVIITINEEGGKPSGVGNMDHSWVTDAQYLINIDSEDYATCTVAACGFMSYQFNVPLTSEVQWNRRPDCLLHGRHRLDGHSVSRERDHRVLAGVRGTVYGRDGSDDRAVRGAV